MAFLFTRNSVHLGAPAALAIVAITAQAQVLPINVTGFNADIVIESTATPPYASFGQVFDGGTRSWYESGLPGSTKGLPAGGGFTSLSDATLGRLSSYSGANSLLLTGSTPTATLAFSPESQLAYDSLAIFAASGGGGGTGTLVITFSDSSTSANIGFNAQDWFNITINNALNNLGRINMVTDVIEDGSAGNPRIYQTTIDLAGLGMNGRTITGITFTKPASGATTAVLGVSGQRAVTALTPVDASGWTHDVVVENTATPPYSASAEDYDTFNHYAWYEQGLAGSTKGLPRGGAFTSLSNPLISAQLRPFDGPNALFLDSGSPTGSLTLSQPRRFEFLAVFACSSNLGGVGSLEISFVDGGTSGPLPFNAHDWFNVPTGNALNNLGRVALSNDTFQDTSAGNPRLYQTVIDLGALSMSDRVVSGITFTKPAVGGTNQNTVIMALSGQPTPGERCVCDWNGFDGLDSQDFFDFLDGFFVGQADYNGVDGTDSQDFFEFLDCFFTGCSS